MQCEPAPLLLPILLTVPIGRLNGMGGAGRAMVAGAGCSLVAALALWLAPPGTATFLTGTAVLGVGHTLMLAARQMIAASASIKAHRDGVLAHVIGPLIVGAVAAGVALAVSVLFAASLVGFGVLMLPMKAGILLCIRATAAMLSRALYNCGAVRLRLTANRVAQFGIPLIAGGLIAPMGAGGVFGLCGAALLGAAAVRPRHLKGRAP